MKYICLVLWAATCIAADVSVVKNGVRPKGKSQTLVFTEQLRFGSSEDQEYFAWSGGDVVLCVNDAGHFFIADNGGNRILEFAADGSFVRQIGRKGKGPGEFSSLKHLTILNDNSAVALDQTQGSSSFSFFDANMEFKEKKQVSSTNESADNLNIRGAIFSPDGQYIYASYLRGPSEYRVSLLSKDFQELKVLKKGPLVPFNMERVEEEAFWSDFLGSWYGVVHMPALVAFGPKGTLFVATDGKYEIIRYDAHMKENLKFSREYKPMFASPEIISALVEPVRASIAASFPPHMAAKFNARTSQDAIEKAQIPPVKDPIFGMVPMEDGGLLVIHDYNPITRVSQADMFDASGNLVGDVVLPRPSVTVGGGFLGLPVNMIFKNKLAYVLEINEDDEYEVVRYSYERKSL